MTSECDAGALLPLEIQKQFTATTTYLDTATMGLPPLGCQEELATQMAAIANGICNAMSFDQHIARARLAFTQIVHCPLDWVAIIPAVSIAAGVVAAHLKPGQRVLVAEEDFTSVLFPFLQAATAGVETVAVPLEQLVERINDDIDWVAVSAVQSADGRRLDLDALTNACSTHGVRSFVDLTQSASWVATDATRFDVTATALYKWMLSPRGRSQQLQAGTPARTPGNPSIGRPCAWQTMPAATIFRPAGYAGRALPLPWSCWPHWGRRRSVGITWHWPTAFAPHWG